MNYINYSTQLFTDIYGDVDTFTSDYSSINLGGISDSTLLTKLYYLLYARYGNSPIANMDVNQFKYKLFSVIFMYGPAWEKRLDIQTTLRNMSESDLKSGAFTIYNHALNPNTAPSTASNEELTYINDQNTTRYKKGNLDAYAALWELINTDVSNQFLNKFQICFKKVASKGAIVYSSEED